VGPATPGTGLYESLDQHRPVLVLRMPASAWRSTPSLMPRFMASLTPTMEMASKRLLQILATCPAPGPPQLTTFLPMCWSSVVLARSKSAASRAPTMNVSVPSRAPLTPPDTGASTSARPVACAALEILCDSDGLTVEESTSSASRLSGLVRESSPLRSSR
jgi:hypothetical protein